MEYSVSNSQERQTPAAIRISTTMSPLPSSSSDGNNVNPCHDLNTTAITSRKCNPFNCSGNDDEYEPRKRSSQEPHKKARPVIIPGSAIKAMEQSTQHDHCDLSTASPPLSSLHVRKKRTCHEMLLYKNNSPHSKQKIDGRKSSKNETIDDDFLFEKEFFKDLMTRGSMVDSFYSQALLILQHDSPKPPGKVVDYRCLKTKHAYIVPRNPKGQIYFITDLHLHVHCTMSPRQRQVFENCFTGQAQIIDPAENVFGQDFAVWNDDNYGTKDCRHSFLAQTSELIQKIFPGFQYMMKIPQVGDNRGTIAANIGLTVNDCNQYPQNRSTILGTIRPFLIQLGRVKDRGALKSLGKLAVYTFKDILPGLNVSGHFVLPPTPAGVARHELRRDFAKSLYVDEKDYGHFLAEAISIIIPVIVYPHRDSSNDTSKEQSGTVTINCSLSMNIVTNIKLKKHLQSLGYVDIFPCSVIFYGRSCCGTYFKLMNRLGELEHKNSLGKVVASSIQVRKNVSDERDYIGQVFDSTKYLDKLMNEFQQGFKMAGLASCDKDQSVEQKCVPNCYSYCKISPFTYDVMSKWSIVLDCALEIHFCLKELTVHTVLLYLFCILLNDIQSIVTKIQKILCSCSNPSSEVNGKECYFKVLLFQLKCSLCHKLGSYEDIENTIDLLLEDVLTSFNHTRNELEATRANQKFDQINVSCNQLLNDLVHRDLGIHNSFLSTQDGKDLIQLASLFGLLPLECTTWADLQPFQKSSERIIELTDIKDLKIQEEMFQDTYQYMVQSISAQTTGPLVENIFIAHGEKNLPSHYHYYHPHRNTIQHFFRVKKDSCWELQMLLTPSSTTTNHAHPKAITVTRWKVHDKKGSMHWGLEHCKITCKSKLVVSKAFRQMFLDK